MIRRIALALVLPLAACASTVDGPSRLTGQDLDAAVALYGEWAEAITLDGEPTYIWRRTLLVDGKPRVCELRVRLGFRRTISRASMEGIPDACQLYAVRSQSLDK